MTSLSTPPEPGRGVTGPIGGLTDVLVGLPADGRGANVAEVAVVAEVAATGGVRFGSAASHPFEAATTEATDADTIVAVAPAPKIRRRRSLR